MGASLSFAIITTSYDRDFERCRLLCETIDRHVDGTFRHLIVIDRKDYKLFRPLAGGRRWLIEKEELLPKWIRPTGFAFGRFRRHLWLSCRSRPVGGWLMQQIAKIAISRRADADILVLVDSDVCFVRKFTINQILSGSRVLLYRVEATIPENKGPHDLWCKSAAELLAVQFEFPASDFISQLVVWRSENVEGLCQRIESTTGRHWVAAIANKRRFSEYLAYGMLVERYLGEQAGHYFSDRPLCHSYWDYEPLNPECYRAFIDAAGADQVAIGVQSISDTPIDVIRSAFNKVHSAP